MVIPMHKRNDKKAKAWRGVQKCLPFLRDDEYHRHKTVNGIQKLVLKINKKAPWIQTSGFGEKVSFSQQAKIYYEYRHALILQRAQYVVIALTVMLLVMTGVDLWTRLFLPE